VDVEVTDREGLGEGGLGEGVGERMVGEEDSVGTAVAMGERDESGVVVEVEEGVGREEREALRVAEGEEEGDAEVDGVEGEVLRSTISSTVVYTGSWVTSKLTMEAFVTWMLPSVELRVTPVGRRQEALAAMVEVVAEKLLDSRREARAVVLSVPET